MTTLIALLRGINVGGKNRLPMKDLVAILEQAGARNVRTYIQSGNVVFQGNTKDRAVLSRKIAASISRAYGFEPRVLILELEAVVEAMQGNPFPEAETSPKSLHLGFLTRAPAHPDLDKLEDLATNSERFRLVGPVFYLHAPDGVGRSRLAASAEKLLGVPMTARNWKTICKIRELAESLPR